MLYFAHKVPFRSAPFNMPGAALDPICSTKCLSKMGANAPTANHRLASPDIPDCSNASIRKCSSVGVAGPSHVASRTRSASKR